MTRDLSNIFSNHSLASLEETLADNEFVTLTPAGRQQLQQASKVSCDWLGYNDTNP